MSETIAEIAEREALQAEADDPSEPPEPEPPEPEPEPEPTPEPASDAAIEKRYRALDKESARHAKQVAVIMGDDFAAVAECPACQIPGFVFPFDPMSVEDAMRRGNVEAYFGTGSVTLKPHPTTATCETCDGWGFCATGAKREGVDYDNTVCPDCAGQGWLRTDVAAPAPVQLAPQPTNTSGWTPPGAPPKPEPYYDYATGEWKLAS